MKALTPIIATIVLLLITISVIGVAFIFFSRTTEQAGEDIGGVAEQQLKQLGTNLRVDSAVGNKVYIRNTGSVPITNTSVGFYVNDIPVSAFSQIASIGPGQIAEFTIDTALTNYELKVTGAGRKTVGVIVTTTTSTTTTTTSTTTTTTTTTTSTTTTTIIQSQTFSPFAGTGTIAGGTLVDEVFVASEVATQDCAAGTCSSTNSWNYGFNDNLAVDTRIEFSYDLASLGITGSQITQVTFNLGGCWHGGSGIGRSCGNADNPEFDAAGGTAVFEILNGAVWEQLGTSISLGTDTSSTADNYNTYSRNKIGGFSNGYLQAGILKIRARTTGTTVSSIHEVQQVTDFAMATVTYGA